VDESAVTSAGLPFVGVELGGTKCVCTLAYGPDAILQQRVIPTTLPETTLPAIVATLREWDAAYGFAAMGIASFGPICLDPVDARYGSILATNKSGWRNCDIVSAIAGPFERPFTFDTDVNGAALAEMRWGCAQGLQDFAYVTVGTGIGVGLIVHGLPTRGIGHSEIGHIRVPRTPGDTVASSCRYHDDCVEGLASGSALVLRLDGREVDDLTPDDPVWKPMISALAAMAHTLVATTGPFRIAIGGGVVTRQPHLLAQIETEMEISLAGYMALPPRRPIIVAPALGELAGPLGSIALAMAASAQ
jgi:fructokinase